MQYRKSIFLKCGDDNLPTEDLIRMLLLQAITWLKARLAVDDLMLFTEAKLNNFTISNNANSGDSESLSNVLEDKKKFNILKLIKNT